MKPLPGLLTALALFGAFAVLAWFSAPPPEPPPPSPVVRSFESAAPALTTSSAPQTPAAILAKLERALILGPASSGAASIAAGLDDCYEKCVAPAVGIDFDGLGFMNQLLERSARENPAAVFAWLNRRGSLPLIFGGDAGTSYATTLFHIWVRQDPEAALAAAPLLTFPSRRACAITVVLDHLVKSDPARTRTLCLQHLDDFARVPDLPAVSFDGDSPGNPDNPTPALTDSQKAVFQFYSSLPPGRARGNLLTRLVQAGGLFAADPAPLWNQTPPDVKQDIIAAAFVTRRSGEIVIWPDANALPFPGAEDMARAHAESSASPAASQQFLDAHGESWVSRDPSAAIAWSMARLAGRQRLDTTCNLFHSAAATQFDAAASVWQSLPPGILKAKAAGELLAAAPADRRPDALALLEGLSPHDRTIAEKR